MSDKLEYRAEIDGLRAIAILPVLLYHAQLFLMGGFLGVDIFFVISGYLICRILLNDLVAGTFSISRFYERRLRRIIPALLTVVLLTIPFAMNWMFREDFKEFSETLTVKCTVLFKYLLLQSKWIFCQSE